MAATFLTVSGGTYGTEEIVSGAGYGDGILILLFLPVLWCLPTAFMIGELSSALPAEGGYYAWVRRGLGNFWGFQEAWLSLAASIFDMAIYPTLFVFYVKQMSPWFGVGNHGVLAGLFVVVNLRCFEPGGHPRGGRYLVVAVLFAFGSVRGDRAAGSRARWCACRRPARHRSRRGPRLTGRRVGGHVELYGLG